MTTREDLQKKFTKETGTPVINSQEEPEIDYVIWLEDNLCNLLNATKERAEIIRIKGMISQMVADDTVSSLSAATIMEEYDKILNKF
jgi:hypothetical protein